MIMYGRIKVRDTVRVPPDKLGDDLDEIIEELLWENFEGKLDKEYGMIVCIENVEEIGE